MKKILFLLFISINFVANAQEGLVWNSVFNEDFNDNSNKWELEFNVLRHD